MGLVNKRFLFQFGGVLYPFVGIVIKRFVFQFVGVLYPFVGIVKMVCVLVCGRFLPVCGVGANLQKDYV